LAVPGSLRRTYEDSQEWLSYPRLTKCATRLDLASPKIFTFNF
jgi:hypothetical protein